MPNVGMGEMVLILAIALIVFGPKKLPEIGKGIGKALREFNKAKTDFMDSIHSEVDTEDRPRTASSYSSAETPYSYSNALASGSDESTENHGYAGAHLSAASNGHGADDSADALPYGADFHAVEGESQPSFRTAPPETVPVSMTANHGALAGEGKA